MTWIDCECVSVPTTAIDEKPIRKWKIVTDIQNESQSLYAQIENGENA